MIYAFIQNVMYEKATMLCFSEVGFVGSTWLVYFRLTLGLEV